MHLATVWGSAACAVQSLFQEPGTLNRQPAIARDALAQGVSKHFDERIGGAGKFAKHRASVRFAGLVGASGLVSRFRVL